jgi:hypothetical protein
MLVSAIQYFDKNEHIIVKDHQIITLEYIIIFLVLHILDAPTRPASPTIAYDTVWPVDRTELEVMSPMSSPNKMQRKMFSMMGSPKSPTRSPINAHSPKSISPKKSHSRPTTRYNAQFLQTVKTKIPIILKLLAIDDLNLSELGSESNSAKHFLDRENGYEFFVTNKAFDLLGFIVCGGLSREQNV